MKKNTELMANGQAVRMMKVNGADFICLTDIARFKNPEFPADVVLNWMRSKMTVAFLGLWEQLHNPNFIVQVKKFGASLDIKSDVAIDDIRADLKNIAIPPPKHIRQRKVSVVLDNPLDCVRVIVRTADFATAPKVRKQLKAYLESSDRKDPDLAKRLPSIITQLRPEQLRVCEAAYQMNLFSWENLQPVHLPKKGEFTAVELFTGAGGLSIGLERAGIHVVIANEIMPDFAATLAANRLDVKVINEDSFWEAA